ncbi:MAG: glycosyltransferase [Desulfobacteraceae bacterium]|nr:MAG: glycosyltransferase [Desulfobacteraceae bacterium]
MDISVIIPVYKSEADLPSLIERLLPVLKGLSKKFEIIIVNDGSPDSSERVISDLSARFLEIHGISLMRNYGQHNALLCGIREAKYEIIVTMDDDLQHPPEEIPKLLDKLHEGYDVVYGTPQKEAHGLWRDLASKFTKWALQAAMGAHIAKNVSAFRAFRTELRNAFVDYQSPFVSIDVLLTWGTTRFAAVVVRHEERKTGVSNYTFGKLMTHAFNMLTGFSTLPLQIASYIGFLFMGFGALILIYVLTMFIIYGQVTPGFTFLAASIAIFSGVQLFVLGIIGEYLGRIHFRIFNKPPYVIKKGKKA